MHQHVEFFERRTGKRRIGVRAVEVAAQAESELEPSGGGRLDALDGVEPALAGQFDAEMSFQPLENRVFELGGNAHRPHALHVGMSADREQPGAGPSDHTPQQRQVGDSLDVGHAVCMMRDAHRPRENDAPGGRVTTGDLVDLATGDTRLLADFGPRQRAQMLAQRVPSAGVPFEEPGIAGAHLFDTLGHAGQ